MHKIISIVIITLFIFFTLILIIASIIIWPMLNFGSNSYSPENEQNEIVTEENFPSYLQSTKLVSELPSDAKLLLKTEKTTYAVLKGSVIEGNLDSPDLIISLPSKYILMISNGFCSTMQKANQEGELQFDLSIGATSAAFKYRTLYKYKSCLGI